MKIILEGPDGAGKSHLLDTLISDGLLNGYTVFHRDGPVRSEEEYKIRVDDAQAFSDMGDVIFDRHPVISQSIYGTVRGDTYGPTSREVQRVIDDHLTIICFPASAYQHQEKESDDPEHLQLIKDHHELITHAYRRMAQVQADITVDPALNLRGQNQLVKLLKQTHRDDPHFLDDVRDFTQVMKQYWCTIPTPVPEPVKSLRQTLIMEEAKELVNALEEDDMEGTLDGAIDIVYAVLGTLISAGLDGSFHAGWERVHTANMLKEPGISHRGLTGDVRKPVGWQKPDLSDLV